MRDDYTSLYYPFSPPHLYISPKGWENVLTHGVIFFFFQFTPLKSPGIYVRTLVPGGPAVKVSSPVDICLPSRESEEAEANRAPFRTLLKHWVIDKRLRAWERRDNNDSFQALGTRRGMSAQSG